MYKLGNYQAKGRLNLINTLVTFDTSTGYAQFSNLAIDNIGMYMLSVKMYTINNEFVSQCYSNLIKVLNKSTNETYSDKEANYKFKFNGDYYSLSQDDKNEIKANAYNYISNYNLTVGDIQLYPGSVYLVFYSPNSNSQLIQDLINSGLNISNLIIFNSVIINGITYGEKSDTTSSTSATNNVGAIVGGVIGGIALIVIIIFGYLGLREFNKISKKF